MGMYDTVECDYELPQPEDPKGYKNQTAFQTKDFDCTLSYYRIDSDGNLFENKTEVEYVEGDEPPGSLLKTLGHCKVTKKWNEPVNITTTIRMYDYTHSNNTQFDYWIEYEVCFVDGKLRSVKLVNFETHDNTSRKKQHELFEKQLAASIEYKKTFRYRYFGKHYNFVVNFIFRKLYSFSSKLIKCLQSITYLLNKLQRLITL